MGWCSQPCLRFGVDQTDRFHAWMKVLLRRAQVNGLSGEVPVAAVVLGPDGRAIGHAELGALQQAALILGDWRFNQCCLIVTLEPCPMCAGALVQARMGTVVFGAHDRKRGGLGGTINLSTHASALHKMTVIGGVMEAEASTQLEQWFKQRRQLNR